MLTVYGGLMPLRLLEEVRFWKMQEKEHTVVIRELVPQLEPEYVLVLQEWETVFAREEAEAGQWIEAVLRSPAGVTPYIQMQIEGILDRSIAQSEQFVKQLFIIRSHSKAIRDNPTAQVVLLHIIRESEYFLGVLHAFMTGQPSSPTLALAGSGAPESPFPPAALQAAPPSPLVKAFSTATFYPHKQADKGQQASPTAMGHSAPQNTTVSPALKGEALPASPSPAVEKEREEPLLTATMEGTWSEGPAVEGRPVPIGGHQLPPLPYAYDALEPHIDAETMKLHHQKHHQTYVDGLNNAEKQMQEARRSGSFTLIKHWEREAAFHGAGHYLHTLFWNIMSPQGGGKPSGPIAQQIVADFGSFEAFKQHFSEAADKVEGGGWAILVWSPRSHRLEILQAEKHQNLSQWDVIPLLALDVWEHAYYVKYRNQRSKYIEAWWNVVNWKHVNDRFEAARQIKWAPY